MALDVSPSDECSDIACRELIMICMDLSRFANDDDDNYDIVYLRKLIKASAKKYKIDILHQKSTFLSTLFIALFMALEAITDKSVIKGILQDIENLDFELDEFDVLPLSHHWLIYHIAQLYVKTDHVKAIKKLQKAIRYEYLVFQEKEEKNVIEWVKSDLEDWSKIDLFSLNNLLNYQSTIFSQKRSKRPFYEYIDSREFRIVLFRTLLSKRRMHLKKLYEACAEGANKKKYMSVADSAKIFVEYEGQKLFAGSEEWFKDYYILWMKRDGLVKIDPFNDMCEVTENFLKMYEVQSISEQITKKGASNPQPKEETKFPMGIMHEPIIGDKFYCPRCGAEQKSGPGVDYTNWDWFCPKCNYFLAG